MSWTKLFKVLKDEEGSALVEGAIVLPVFVLIVMGIMEIGLVINIYMNLSMAAASGLQTFSVMRGVSGSYTRASTAAKNSAVNAAWKISPNDLTINLSVAGIACSSDAACDLALTNGAPPSTGGPGATTAISVQYPCGNSLQIYSLLPNFCPMSVQMSGIEQ